MTHKEFFERYLYAGPISRDADMFIAVIDTVFDRPDGTRETMSFVQIFRLSNGKIARLRDYFTTADS